MNDLKGESVAVSHDARSYDDFLNHLGGLMKEAMPATDKARDRMEEAEAERHRLVTQLAELDERIEILRSRYQRDRAVFMEMFDTWKSEYMKIREAPAVGEAK